MFCKALEGRAATESSYPEQTTQFFQSLTKCVKGPASSINFILANCILDISSHHHFQNLLSRLKVIPDNMSYIFKIRSFQDRNIN